MSYLTLLVCSLLVAASYSQYNGWNGGYPGWNGGNNGWSGGNNKRCTCNLKCVDVKNQGNMATCPRGFVATSCSCGNSCGSHNYRGSNTCFCQCANMDWASARCCRNS